MKPSIREIIAAHSTLVQLYRQVFPLLKTNLKAQGIVLDQDEPYVVPEEPYNVGTGIEPMRHIVGKARLLKVSSLHDTTLYHSGGNAWFRTVHDMVHLLYSLGFTPDDEAKVHHFLWLYITAVPAWWALTEPQRRLVAAVYNADTYGQTAYERRKGSFPADQAAFVIKHVQRSLRNAQA